MDYRAFYVSKFKDTVPLAEREESAAEGAGKVQLDGLFQDLKHGCMHKQAVLIKQLSGSYVLKTVEKNWDCYRHSQKCMHKLTAKAMKGKAQDSDRGISGISTNHK